MSKGVALKKFIEIVGWTSGLATIVAALFSSCRRIHPVDLFAGAGGLVFAPLARRVRRNTKSNASRPKSVKMVSRAAVANWLDAMARGYCRILPVAPRISGANLQKASENDAAQEQVSPMPVSLSESDWTRLIALLGALAWLPHLIRWFVRPRVTIIAGTSLEVGFTTLGPLFNPSLAFRTERRDALITALTFEVVHERGQRATFEAHQLVETPGSTQSSTGDFSLHQRIQAVIAIVLTPLQIAERKVNCRVTTHVARNDSLVFAYQSAIRRVANLDAVKWEADALATPESHALRDFWLKEFFWSSGIYTVEARATIQGKTQPVKKSFRFQLSDEHMAGLNGNRAGIDFDLRGIAADVGARPRNPARFDWHWVYTSMLRESN